MKFSLVCALLLSSSAFAAKSYQVTGEVLNVTDSLVVVKKGSETFEIDRTPSTKVTGELKKGGKATVYYTMASQEIEAKEAKKK